MNRENSKKDNIIERNLFFYKDIWSIKVGKITDGKMDSNTLSWLKPSDINYIKAEFIADPFLIKDKNTWYLFYEILLKYSRKGVIGYSYSNDGETWINGDVVLEEDWHLSYPYVFKDKDKIFMIPESAAGGAIMLYKAIKFPDKWVKVKDLIKGCYWDSSVIYYDNKWWMFTLGNNPSKFSLYLFYSENITGPWKEHKMSPVVVNNKRIARPGGRIINNNDKLIRYVQDCEKNYGEAVIEIEIVKLTIDEYKEQEKGVILEKSNIKNSWNKDGMHTIDTKSINDCENMVAIDGYYLKKVNRITNKIEEILMGNLRD